jgi:hypothetical protein
MRGAGNKFDSLWDKSVLAYYSLFQVLWALSFVGQR